MNNLLRRIYYTFIKRHAHVRPYHDFLSLEEAWQVNMQNVFEAFAHDLTLAGPIIAVENLCETVAQAWNSTNVG